ncbi:MAG TPA: DivIVA domain-containing protein [Actinomycetota bacterium]|nr:DivIVA domain-containing protein [Actinomycetota bacterium]
MSTSDLDMPLLPSSEQIRRREFATVRRGYDPQQVRMYLTSIAEQIEKLERELSQLRLETGAAVARREAAPEPAPARATDVSEGDPYAALSKRFAHLIEIADQEAARTIDDARQEAARTLDEARSEADRIRVDAQAQAEEARQEGADLLERARLESDRVVSGLADRRRALMDQLQEMRSTLLAAADELAFPLENARADEDGDGEPDGGIPDQREAAAPAADPVDPRCEDLWVSPDAVDLPDLASIDLDFDEQA